MNIGRYYALAQCGMEMVIPTIAGIFIDKWLGTAPIFIILLTIFGFVGGITHIIYLSNQIEKAEKEEKAKRTKHE